MVLRTQPTKGMHTPHYAMAHSTVSVHNMRDTNQPPHQPHNTHNCSGGLLTCCWCVCVPTVVSWGGALLQCTQQWVIGKIAAAWGTANLTITQAVSATDSSISRDVEEIGRILPRANTPTGRFSNPESVPALPNSWKSRHMAYKWP